MIISLSELPPKLVKVMAHFGRWAALFDTSYVRLIKWRYLINENLDKNIIRKRAQLYENTIIYKFNNTKIP